MIFWMILALSIAVALWMVLRPQSDPQPPEDTEGENAEEAGDLSVDDIVLLDMLDEDEGDRPH